MAAPAEAGNLFVVNTGGGSAKYQNVIGVAGSGASFTSIQDALDSISDAAGDNRYLITVGPGTYEETVQLKEWVDLVGASRQATVITSPGGSAPGTATVIGANNCEISNLTIESTGDDYTYSVGVYSCEASPRLNHLDIIVQGSTVSNMAGVYNYNEANTDINDINVQISGGGSGSTLYGIYTQYYSAPTIRNSRVEITSESGAGNLFAFYTLVKSEIELNNLDIVISGNSSTTLTAGIQNIDSTAVIDQCRIILEEGGATAHGVENLSGASVQMTNTNITMSATEGTTYVGVLSDSSDDVALSNVNIDISAATETQNIGVCNYSCSPALSNLNIDVSGAGTNDVGVTNNSASPEMVYCSIVVDQPSEGTGMGIYNMYTSRPLVSFCNIRGGHFGIMNSSGSTSDDSMLVNKSRVNGSTQAVVNVANYTLSLTSNILDGGVTNSGAITCADCYDESGNAETCE